MKRFLCLLLLAASTVSAAYSLPENYGVTAFESRIGARSYGIGGAVSTLGDEKNASLSNPANLYGTQGVFFSLKDAKNLAIAQIFPVSFGTAALGLVTKDIRDINMSGTSFSYSNSYGMLMFAGKFYGINAGANVKIILNQEIRTGSTSKSGTGWDADLGLSASPLRWLRLGVILSNILPMNFLGGGVNTLSDNTTDNFPSKLTAGPAIKLLGANSLLRVNSIGDLVLFIDVENDLHGNTPTLLHSGAEWTRQGLPVAIRLGASQQMKNNVAETIFTFGCGISLADGQFDAAYNSGNNSGSGIFSAFYSPFEFRSEKEASKIPYLKIYSPADKTSTAEPSIRISGETDKQRLSINGIDVYVKEDGTFNALVPLYIGKNLIQITASNEGYRTIAKRYILRTAKVTVKQAVKIEKKKIAIKTELDSLLQKALALAAKGSDPGLTEKEKKKIEENKAALDQKREAVKARLDNVILQENYIKQEAQKVETLATLGVIDAKKTTDFDAEERITRAELAMWLVKARSLSSPVVSSDLFPDVSSRYWAARYINTAVKKGFMQPYPDGLFHPDDYISEKDGVETLKKFDSIR